MKVKMIENVSHGYRDQDGKIHSVTLLKGQIFEKSALPPSLPEKFYVEIQERKASGEKRGKKRKRAGGRK